MTFRKFCLPTTFSGPPDVFKKKWKKIDVFPIFFDISAYRRLFEISTYRRLSGDLPSTSCRHPSHFYFTADVRLRFPPTDDFSRFLPTDDLQRTSRRLFKKNAKKIDVFPIFFDISAYRSLFEISAYRRPSEDLPTSFEKKI